MDLPVLPSEFFSPFSRAARLDELSFNPAEIINRIPSSSGSEVFGGLIRDILAEAPKYLDIRGGWLVLHPSEIEFSARHIRAGGTEFHIRSIISPRLKKSATIALLAVSIGSGMENRSKALLAADDFLEGYAVDIVASELAEAAADFFQEELANGLRGYGWNTTARYSPGYCGWDVVEQKKIFTILPPGFCGISLNHSAMMSPVKSVSAIIGLGPEARRENYDCQQCDMEDCLHRRNV